MIGASGLSEDGPSEVFPAAAGVKRVMMACATRRMLLVDATKFDQDHVEIVCPLDEISEIVTDRKPPPHLVSALRGAGVTLYLPRAE